MVSNFSLFAATTLLRELDILITVAAHNRDHAANYDHDVVAATDAVKEALRQTREQIDAISEMTDSTLALMKSSHVENAKDRLNYWLRKDDGEWRDVFERACRLRDAIRIEFREHLFFSYEREKGKKLQSWEADWKAIIAAFPDARIESFNAVDCYALQHPTASVFHSMRVAEYGLRAIAKERRVSLPKNKPLEWGTWQEIIKALDAEIKTIGTTWKAGKRKDAALAFYSGARADLNGFKDEYRNLVMHTRGQYDEFQALRALTQVHGFMSRLAEKIDHAHSRISWGRT